MSVSNSAAAQLDQPVLVPLPRAKRKWISLRTKGLLAFAVLIGYAVVVSAYVLHQKDLALGYVTELQRVYKLGEVLRHANNAVFHTVIVVNNNIYSGRRGDGTETLSGLRGIDLGYKLVQANHGELMAVIPDSAPSLAALDETFARASVDPSQANLIDLAQRLNVMVTKLAEIAAHVREREAVLTQEYRVSSDSVVMTALVYGLLGLVLFGAVISLFFTRLTADLRALQARAVDIVKGYRGDPLPVGRYDEVGQLMQAVNHMAADLEEHEKQLAIERQKYHHHEKMAAIGSLAAGVAHEIGNPIAAISGLAQAMQEAHLSGECPHRTEACQPSMILSQTSRLAQICREVSDFATSRPAESELRDLNGLIRSTTSLMRYDKRVRRIALELDLDSQLPAVNCVGDQIIQVIMNLLINAADALENSGNGEPRITVRTSVMPYYVVIAVSDNGCGMDAQTLQHAVEAFFTTKPEGRGSGLGLALCQSIATSHHGRLEIDSEPGVGTEVRFLLPLAAE